MRLPDSILPEAPSLMLLQVKEDQHERPDESKNKRITSKLPEFQELSPLSIRHWAIIKGISSNQIGYVIDSIENR